MTEYRNDSQDYPLAFKDRIPGISLPPDFEIVSADKSLIGPNPALKPAATTTATTQSVVATTTTTPPIRFPSRKVSEQGEAIARLVGSFSGPGFNVIFRPHGDKTLGEKFKDLVLNGDDLLELNLTHELWTFPSVAGHLGDIPNRVAHSNDLDVFLRGIPYTQLVREVTATTGKFNGKRIEVDRLGVALEGDWKKRVEDIHFEPGLLLHIPATGQNEPRVIPTSDKATISRMASIPHGTTINAQGAAAVVDNTSKGPVIPSNEKATRPFNLITGKLQDFDEFKLDQNKSTRIPQNLELFSQGNFITKDMLNDPNHLLRAHNKNKKFSQTITFTVSTLPPAKPALNQACPHLAQLAAKKAMQGALTKLDGLVGALSGDTKTTAAEVSSALKKELAKLDPPASLLNDLGGPAKAPAIGTANIAFLDGEVGKPAFQPGAPNASTGKVESTFWISTVVYKIKVDKKYVPTGQKGPDDKPTNVPTFDPINEGGWDPATLPAFVFPADKPVEIGVYEVEATQIQYSQTVLLNFNTLAWPHISVATVVPIRPILVNFAKKLS